MRRYRPKQVQERLHIAPSTLRLWSTRFADWLGPYAQPRRRNQVCGKREYTEDDVATLEFVEQLLRQRLTYEAIKGRVRDRAEGLARERAAEEQRLRREQRLRQLAEVGRLPPGITVATGTRDGPGETAAGSGGGGGGGASHAGGGPHESDAGDRMSVQQLETTIRALRAAVDAKDQVIAALLRNVAELEREVGDVRRERDEVREEARHHREFVAKGIAGLNHTLALLADEVHDLRDDQRRQEERARHEAQEAQGRWRWPRRA